MVWHVRHQSPSEKRLALLWSMAAVQAEALKLDAAQSCRLGREVTSEAEPGRSIQGLDSSAIATAVTAPCRCLSLAAIAYIILSARCGEKASLLLPSRWQRAPWSVTFRLVYRGLLASACFSPSHYTQSHTEQANTQAMSDSTSNPGLISGHAKLCFLLPCFAHRDPD